MAIEQIADKVIETDVLVVGGGIAGCSAAAKAVEHGLNVTLAEKAKTDRSGSAGQGIDHYNGAYPRGMTPKEFADIIENLTRGMGIGLWPLTDKTRLYRVYANGAWAIEELEKLGVTMRWDDGELRPMDASLHWGWPCIRVHWQNVKPQLAAAVRKRGVNVLERTMVIDLLTNNGRVVGATAVSTRTGEFIVIKAKTTVMASADCARIYNPDTPVPWKYKFRYHWCPASVSGDGWAMAYRAGAELSDMEQGGRGYRFRDDLALSYGNTGNEGIQCKRFTWDGEENRRRLEDLEREGKDPFYYSLEFLPDDFQKRIEVAYADERMVSFKIAEDRGFNPRTHWYEMMENRPNQLHVYAGINTDAYLKASLQGLYAAGDAASGVSGCSNATTSGLLVGDSVHNYVSIAGEPVIDEAQVEGQKQTALAPLSVKDGTEPMELECAIRYICDRYVGTNRAEGKLREGMRRLGTLRRVFLPKLMAKNPHQLMRCLEVRNIIDVAEVHMQACLERKETRGQHFRLDYPERNPAWNGMLTYQRMEDSKAIFEMREPPPLNLELREER